MRSSTFVSTAIVSAAVVLAADDANQWATYPSVAKTASINGFADRIVDTVPECAKSCLESQGTGNTPCPYWDTGCLCVMPQFNGPIAECVIKACGGSEVGDVASQATAACSAAGVWEPYWMLPSSDNAAISSAIANTEEASSATSTEESPSATPTSEAPAKTSSEAPAETSSEAASSEAPSVTSAPESSETPAPSSESSEAPESESASAPTESSAATVTQANGANKQLIGSVGVVAALALLI